MGFEGKNQPVENIYKAREQNEVGGPAPAFSCSLWSPTAPLQLLTSPVWSHPSNSKVIIAQKSWADLNAGK